MKEINFDPAADAPTVSALQSQWIDSQAGSGKTVIVAANQDAGPGKEAADRIDGELKQFASSPLDHPSANIVEFQKLIGKFEDTPDKKQAMQSLGDDTSRLRVKMDNESQATNNELEADAAKVPGRAALNADLEAKENKFFGAASNLGTTEEERVLNLLQWQPGDTRDTRDQRVRDGLNNPALLQSFNAMEASADKVDQSKTAEEKQLEQLHRQEVQDAGTVRKVINEAFIRSQIDQ